jgi:DHA2 family multidrug resistance protein-like MFS transporter
LIGAALVFFMFPKLDEERQLLAEYHAEDTSAQATDAAAGDTPPQSKEVAA